MDDNFLSLIKSIADLYTFEYKRFNSSQQNFENFSCKCLTMLDLNQIIESSIQDGTMLVGFYTTITNLLKKSVLVDTISQDFTVVDRLMYILQSRLNSVSSSKTISGEDGEITFNFTEIIKNLQDSILSNPECFSPKIIMHNDITILCNIPTIESDLLVGEEFYKFFTVNIDDEDDVKLFIGQNFILELVKCIRTITIKDSILDFSVMSIEDRIKTIEEIPTIIMQDVIAYNKNYKKIINDCLTIDGYILPINGSLFLQ